MFEPHPNSSNNSNNIRAANLKSDLLVLVKNKGTVREFAYDRVKAPVFKKHYVKNRSSHANVVGFHLFQKREWYRLLSVNFAKFFKLFYRASVNGCAFDNSSPFWTYHWHLGLMDLQFHFNANFPALPTVITMLCYQSLWAVATDMRNILGKLFQNKP